MTMDLSPRKRGGQPKVSLDRLRTFVAFIGTGLTPASAGRAVGISDTTRKDWTRRGRRELVRLADDGLDPIDLMNAGEPAWPTDVDWRNPPEGFDPTEWPFVAFAVATEKALASFEATHLRNIARAASSGPERWQASAWLLERRFPELYGRPEARARLLAMQEAAGPQREVEQEVLSVDDIEARFAEVDEVMRQRREGTG